MRIIIDVYEEFFSHPVNQVQAQYVRVSNICLSSGIRKLLTVSDSHRIWFLTLGKKTLGIYDAHLVFGLCMLKKEQEPHEQFQPQLVSSCHDGIVAVSLLVLVNPHHELHVHANTIFPPVPTYKKSSRERGEHNTRYRYRAIKSSAFIFGASTSTLNFEVFMQDICQCKC